MENKEEIFDPSDIFSIFDELLADIEFFKYPRLEAFLHSFRLLEAFENNVGVGNIGLDESITLSRYIEDIKKYLIYWIYTRCLEGGNLVKTEEIHIKETIPVLQLAHKFSLLHDAVVAAQKGWMTVNFDEQEKKINFKYKNSEKGALFFLKFFDRVNREIKSITNILQEEKNQKNLYKALNLFSNIVYITKDGELRYSTNEFIVNSFEDYIRASINQQSILCDSWSLGPYTIGDFRSVWIQINKLSLIHIIAFVESYRKYGNYDPGFNYSIFKISRISLIRYIRKYTRLNEVIISEILQDLTYDYSIPHMDIIYQPLIKINNVIFFSPNLIIKSFFDRNLQVLLSKLPHRKSEYDRLKNLKEGKMINDLAPYLEKFKFGFKDRIILREKGKIKTDIDLLVWDERYKDFLIIQLKWFYGPDSTQELFNHDQQFNEAIRKTKNCIKYMQYKINEVIKNLKLPNVKEKKNIYGIILSKMGTPSPYIEDPYFPIIEEADFIDLLKNSSGNVTKLYNSILDLCESKKRIENVKVAEVGLEVGDYNFILPAVEY